MNHLFSACVMLDDWACCVFMCGRGWESKSERVGQSAGESVCVSEGGGKGGRTRAPRRERGGGGREGHTHTYSHTHIHSRAHTHT